MGKERDPMDATYATGGQEQARADGVIVMAISFLTALLVIAGLISATGTGQRHQAALAAAGCEPNLSPAGLQCTTAAMLTSQYVALVTPASQQLGAEAAAYTAGERSHLAAAEVALTAEVNSEHALDASLAAFPFPPALTAMATVAIRADQARAALTAGQARSSSVTQLRSFDRRVQAADPALPQTAGA
jgi:hypothetical protein